MMAAEPQASRREARPQDVAFGALLETLFEMVQPDDRAFNGAQVSTAVGVTGNYIPMCRRGQRSITDKDKLRLLTDFFGVDPDYFDQSPPAFIYPTGEIIQDNDHGYSASQVSALATSVGVEMTVQRAAALRAGLARPTLQEAAALELALDMTPGPLSGSKDASELAAKLLAGEAKLLAAFAATTMSEDEAAEVQRQIGALALINIGRATAGRSGSAAA